MNQFPGELTGHLGANEARLFIIRQFGDQAQVRVSIADEHERLSIPGRRAGCVFVFLEAEVAADYRVIIEQRFQDSIESAFEVKEIELHSVEDLLAADALYKAEIAWHVGTKTEINRAHEYLDVAIESGSGIPTLLDHAYYFKGLIAYQQFKFTEARASIAQLSRRWWQDEEFEIATLWVIGAIALEQYQHEEARSYLDTALTLSCEMQDKLPWIRFDQVEIRLYLALVLMRLGETAAGAKHLHLGFEVSNALNSKVLEGKLRNNHAAYIEHFLSSDLADYVANYERARSEYEVGLELLDAAGEIVTRTSTLANLGRLAMMAGEFSLAQRRYHRAISINNSCHNEVLRGYLYSQVGSLYLNLGELSRAKHYVQHSLKSRTEAGVDELIHLDRIQLGRIARLQGESDLALEYLLPVLNQQSSNANAAKAIPCIVEIAKTYLEQGEAMLALGYSEMAYGMRGSLDLPNLYAEVCRVQIEALWAAKRTTEAHAAIDSLLPYVRGIAYTPEIIEALSLAMDFYFEREPERAIEYGEEACELVESLRGRLDVARLGPSFADKTSSLFQMLARLYFLQARRTDDELSIKEGVHVLERGRASVLEMQKRRAQELTESRELVEAKRKVNLLTSKRMSSAEMSQDQELTNAYYEALEALSSELTSTVSVPEQQFDIDRFLQDIPSRHVILEFVWHDGILGVAMLTHNEVFYEELPQIDLWDQVASYQQALRAVSTDASLALEALLPKLVLQRVMAAESVTIVPAGPLQYLPFASLKFTQMDREIYLGDVVAISYAYSLSSIGTESTSASVAGVCVFADPEFQSSLPGVSEFQRDQLRHWSAKLERLPWTAKEASYIETTLPNTPCQLFVGAEASKQNLCLKEVRSCSILHIASHGYFSSQLDDVAGIALAPDQGDNESGFLALTDLVDMGFDNKLIVVSGCETGIGKQVEGEGLMSVSRGFLSQGAETVVSTLWPVSDRASALFMKLFYQQLHTTGSPVAALKNSQQALRRDPRYSAPFYWAGYVVHSSKLMPRLHFG